MKTLFIKVLLLKILYFLHIFLKDRGWIESKSIFRHLPTLRFKLRSHFKNHSTNPMEETIPNRADSIQKLKISFV